MIVGALPVAIVMVGSLALLPPLPVVMAAVLVMYAAGTTLSVAFNALAGDIVPPAKRRMFLSLFVTCQDLGAALGPLLGYWIGPQFGLTWLYICGVIVLAVASLLYLAAFGSPNRTTTSRHPPVPQQG